MKSLRALLPLLIASIGTLSMALAVAAPRSSPKTAQFVDSFDEKGLDTSSFFPESKLRPDQTGYALTVFQGTKIDRFNVRILGVLHGMNNGRDFIVIKVTSGPSVTDNLNIAEGMSGSPVYVDNRLVGAIAASFPFGTSPIGFVTPIGDMLDAWDPNLPSQPNISLSSALAGENSESPADAFAVANILGHDYSAFSPQSLAGIRPMQTPVMVSGMSQDGISRLSDILRPYGMVPISGGGMSSSKLSTKLSGADQLIPGAALGCSLVQGDFDYTAIGTVTYRDKNRLIAFGHPFLGLGAIDAPLTTVNIVTMYPSYQTSTKLGEPLYNVGRVFQDRPFSIGGELGVAPHMVPMTVNVTDNTNKRHRRYHFEIINHPLLTAQFVVLVAQQAILETHGSPGDAIAKVTTTVDADQVGRITRSNVFYDSLSIEQTSTNDLDSLTRLLTSNSFFPLSIKGVDMDVTIDSSHATAQVDHIFVPKTDYKPGETVEVGVVIKPYKSEPVLKTISLKIPSSTPAGIVTLVVKGGGISGGQTISLGGTTIVLHSQSSSQGPTPSNVNQLIRQFLDQPKNNDLVATLQLPTTAVTVQGENLSLLPPIMSSVMRSARSTGVRTARDQVKLTEPTQYILTGSQTISLTVAHASSLDTSTDDSSVDASPDASESDVSTGSDDSSSSSDSTATTRSDRSGANSTATRDETTIVPVSDSVDESSSSDDSSISSKTDETLDSKSLPDVTSEPDASSSLAKITVVGRLAKIWQEDTAQDFDLGTLDNTTVTSANDVRLSLSLKPVAESTSSYIWCLARDKSGTLYAGTGDDGIVYQLLSGGSMKPFFRTGELEVTSLAYDPSSGTLYAGTSPHGLVFAIASTGVGKRLGSVGDKYVTSLVYDAARSRLYAATGGGTADVYVFEADGPPKLFFTSPETHLLSLALDTDGTLYAGGSPDGVIYAISPAGGAQVVYDSAQPNITALAVDGRGYLYAGTSPAGLIYKISPRSTTEFDRDVKVLSAQPKAAVSGLGVDGDGNVWASSGDSLYCVNPDNITYTYTAPTDVTLLSLLTSDSGQIYAGTGNTASIYRLGDNRTDQTTAYQGTYVSPIHDAHRPSRWGTITWNDVTPPGTSLTLQTRSGDVPAPDQTWSGWSSAYTIASGQQIDSPPARFVQYKAVLQSANPQVRTNAMPRLTSVSIYYMPRSQPPIVSVSSPSEGDFLNGIASLHWTALDSDHDTLSYDVYYSSDGINYLPMPKSTTTTAPATADVTEKLKEELDKHSEIPQAVRDQMLQQAGGGDSSTDAKANHVTTSSFSWDTKTVPDGQYQIKVVASNYQSDPSDTRTGEGYSGPFIVANTAPIIKINASDTRVNPDDSITLDGSAITKLAFVKAVQYRLDKSTDLYSAASEDGMFDSTDADWAITSPKQGPGPHVITITAVDQAGNTTVASTTVVVP